MESERYLIDLQHREKEGIRRLLAMPFLSQKLLSSLGLEPGFNWYLLEIRMDRLSEFNGEIDVLAGRLTWHDSKVFEFLLTEEAKRNPNWHPSWHFSNAALKLALEGGIMWPPPIDYLIGIEAKCARLDPHAEQISEETIKAKKSSWQEIRHTQEQLKRLVNIGFNRVALLDMIATPPASGPGAQAWFSASDIALQSWMAMGDTLGKRLTTDSPVGHWVWPIGAVIGGDEMQRGAGAPIELQTAEENPFLQIDATMRQRRQKMEDRLKRILEDLPRPRSFPVIFLDCRSCGKVHTDGVTCS